MSAEARALQSARMKAKWLNKKAQTGEAPADPALREAMAKVPMNAVTIPVSDPEIRPSKLPETYVENALHAHIWVDVDWEHIPMREGQQFYAQLKAEFEKAGRLLNVRSMERVAGYTCFMCKKHFDGNPGFTDFSYVDPVSGLSPRVDCCGELCVINYNAMRINQRHQRSLAQAAQERNG